MRRSKQQLSEKEMMTHALDDWWTVLDLNALRPLTRDCERESGSAS